MSLLVCSFLFCCKIGLPLKFCWTSQLICKVYAWTSMAESLIFNGCPCYFAYFRFAENRSVIEVLLDLPANMQGGCMGHQWSMPDFLRKLFLCNCRKKKKWNDLKIALVGEASCNSKVFWSRWQCNALTPLVFLYVFYNVKTQKP